MYAHLRYESGVHRVQRVPVTEAGGRIHTSTASVAVLPEIEETEIEINPSDLRIDVMRSGGPGGQSVNTTDSAVRITHLPTGIVVHCQDEKSQHKNKAKALKILRARLYEAEEERKHADRAQARKSQIGSGDRAEKIRTYNFPQNRATDHRINLTLYKLDAVMKGEIVEFIDALRLHAQESALKVGARPDHDACRHPCSRRATTRFFSPKSIRPSWTPSCSSPTPSATTKEKLLASMPDQVDPEAQARFRGFIDQRCKGIPVSYIRNVKEFYGLEFYVDERVLVPRPDTEAPGGKGPRRRARAIRGLQRVHDVGTGSGCIGIAIKRTVPRLEVERLGYLRPRPRGGPAQRAGSSWATRCPPSTPTCWRRCPAPSTSSPPTLPTSATRRSPTC